MTSGSTPDPQHSTYSRPFADAVVDYAQAGWPCIMPVPLEKAPPPSGFTGADGRDTDPLTLVRWATTHADSSIALRMPDGVIGIDVDDYVKGSVTKHGAATLAQLEERFGPLPRTWSSTARGAGAASRIRFYRVPAQRYVTRFPDVEIIQRHHRYAVVWPSPHPAAGDIYRWYDPTGAEVAQPPKPGELPELPAAWVDGLREGATDAGPAAADAASGAFLLDQIRADSRPPCPDMVAALEAAHRELQGADVGSRHDVMTGRIHNVVQAAAAGHTGAGPVLDELAGLWAGLTVGEDRAGEFDRMLLTSARKAVTVVGPRQVGADPCMALGGLEVGVPIGAALPVDGGPPPGDDRPGHDDPDPIRQPRDLHPAEVLGPTQFSPRANLDQRLADAVLERMWPVLRYGYDEGAWLLRERVSWATRADLAEWAIAQVAETMPRGNPDAEKGSEEHAQAERRKRLMSAGPAGAVAKKMRARVTGGAHPCALRIGDLDSEPWLMWAGGLPWDLTASLTEPAQAQIDPATPHMRSAGVAPALAPTPLWDAFTTAVWPDRELRAWALRVLAVAFTGYADKALPILIGERDRGKTQVVALLMSVLGSYAHAADPRLLNGLDNAHASIIYALKGRRLSFIDEGPREGRLGQERLKQLTGGGDLTGNQMNRNPITFTPTHTLVLTANDEPILTDPAIRSRTRLIPCEGDPAAVRAARAAIGHTTSKAWRREAPGVLAAMMREAAAWLADPSSAMTAAAPEAYRGRADEIALAQDPVRHWLEDETEPNDVGERSRVLYEAFVGWSRNGNAHPSRIVSETRWGRELTEAGYPPEKRRDGNYRRLRIVPRGFVLPGLDHGPVTTGGGLGPNGGGFVEGSKPTLHTPTNPPQARESATQPSTQTISVEGVEGSPISLRAYARDAHAREARPENGPDLPQPSTHSAAITASLTADRSDPSPALPAGVITCGPGPISDHDAAAVREFAEQLSVHGEPDLIDQATFDQALAAGPGGLPAGDHAVHSPAQLLALEYHQLREQQDRRVEDATRGALTDHRGRDSEEVLRYFGEGEFAGQGVEPRLTWRRFLEQRRPDREHAKALQAAFDAGAKLGRKHASKTVADADAEYERAAKGRDEEQFAAGYAAGIGEHDQRITDAAGPSYDLPAIVVRDGHVTSISLEEARIVAETFEFARELTVDVETSGYPVGHADYALRTIQVGNEHAAIVFDAADPDQVNTAAAMLAAADVLHAHSASADLVPLAVAGAIDLEAAWARMHDTVIPAKLADPTSTGSDPGLKQLAGAVLGASATAPTADEARAALFKAGKWLTDTKVTTPIDRSGWAQVDSRSETMIRYAASDVLDTGALAKVLPAVTPAVLERERTAQTMTVRVAFHGVRLDGEHVAAQVAEHTPALAEAAERLRAFGIDNPGSDQQVAAKLIELGAPLPRTKTGRPSVAKGGLDPFRKADGAIGDLVRARLDYQHHETVLSTFLEPYRQLVERGDGRARPTVYTLGADTGRMSCVRPNLQQVPRQGGMRACVTADPDEVIISADFASVEIRVAAALTGDTNLQAMLAAGVDLHMQTARQAYGPDATKEDRYNTKRGVFGRLYGSGIPGIARTLAVSEAEAAAIVASLDAMTPEMTRWIEGLKEAVKGGMRTFETYSGRVIHLDPRMPHKAFNYCVQGTARELLIDALIRWRDTKWGHCRLIPVHDELLVFVPEDDAQEATAALTAAMASTLYGVEIKAEASNPSFAWQDAS